MPERRQWNSTLTRRTELVRRASAALKSKPINHKPRRLRRKRPTEITQHEARLMAVFHSVVAERGECANCGYDGVFLEAHHAIGKQLLKRVLSKKGEPCPLEVIWDKRNAVVLCQEPAPNRCHQRHTIAFRRAGRHVLRPENWQFARDHDLEWVLLAEYPERRDAA